MTRAVVVIELGTVHNVRDAAEFVNRFVVTAAQEHGYSARLVKVEVPNVIKALTVEE